MTFALAVPGVTRNLRPKLEAPDQVRSAVTRGKTEASDQVRGALLQ